jgi:hypothetical protein
MVRVEDDGSTTIVFGDGKTGRRLPSGARIDARYERGSGDTGNTANADSLGEALIDLWAQMADVAARHQDAVAGEAYLETAGERISLDKVTDLRRAIGERQGDICITICLRPREPR